MLEAEQILCDILLVGGRVIDPETDLDEVASVGIHSGRIVHIGHENVAASQIIDVSGLVVAPGFIDLHSHAQSVSGLRLQALDGVTTSLELEAGAAPVADHYAAAIAEGRPINFGYSAGWVYSRMRVLDGASWIRPQDDDDYGIAFNMFNKNQDGARWRGPADAGERTEILELVRQQIKDGAIGIGVLAGYAPDSTGDEFTGLAQLAAEFDQPMFVHARSMAATEPNSALDAVNEIVATANACAAPIHLCHMNSTSGQLTAKVAEVLSKAQQGGVRVTTEVYPYSAGSTVIGAAFLAPDQLERNHLKPTSLLYLATGERVADAQRLEEIRTNDPGGLCIIENFDENDPAELELLMRALTFPEAAIASDAMPMTFFGDESMRASAEEARRSNTWPVPEGFIAHPRSAGCFAKALSWLTREKAALTLQETIRRCTLIPANILAQAAPAMKSKGRLQVGADADITVFNPETVAPRGGYLTLKPSTGFDFVLVGGEFIVSEGRLCTDALPGKAIWGAATVIA